MRCNGKPTCGCRPCGRRRDIVTLLRSLRDAGETLQRGDGGGKIKFESRALSMPAAWHAGSYVELIEALTTLYSMGRKTEEARGLYWNVVERYLVSERLTGVVAKGGDAIYLTVGHNIKGSGKFEYFTVGERLRRNMEMVGEPVRDKECIKTPLYKPKHIDRPLTLFRAMLERWHPEVRQRPLETGLDALSFLMPATIRLPREVPLAA